MTSVKTLVGVATALNKGTIRWGNRGTDPKTHSSRF